MRGYILSLVVGGSLAVVAVPSRTPRVRDVLVHEVSYGQTEESEIARIRAHFDSVLVELGGRDVSTLTEAQRANRAGTLVTLRAYRDRGVFPRNYDFPEAPTPYFVDRRTGVLCAVAHLLESTGRRDIVDRVARTNNNVWVSDLAGDSALAHWLETQGLTLQEAARIQVPYTETNTGPYVAASLVGVGASAATSTINLTLNRSGRAGLLSMAGALSGLGTMALGFAGTKQDAPAAAIVVNVGAGTLALLTSVRSQIRYEKSAKLGREEDQRKQQADARGIEASVSPLLALGSQGTAGLAVQVRF